MDITFVCRGMGEGGGIQRSSLHTIVQSKISWMKLIE